MKKSIPNKTEDLGSKLVRILTTVGLYLCLRKFPVNICHSFQMDVFSGNSVHDEIAF